jgi:hypothetical protein
MANFVMAEVPIAHPFLGLFFSVVCPLMRLPSLGLFPFLFCICTQDLCMREGLAITVCEDQDLPQSPKQMDIGCLDLLLIATTMLLAQ